MKIYDEFKEYLDNENKEKSVQFILDNVKNKEITIVDLYKNILTPSLNNLVCSIEDKEVCIWKEHVRTSIVRTILECCYPYIIQEKDKNEVNKDAGTVIVLCPTDEYHEIGARMVSDYFTLCGYDSIFVGSNTPKNEFLSAINVYKPKFIAISVTNYYNLISAKRTIEAIRAIENYGLQILVGGHAFENNQDAWKKIGADMLIKDFEDIKNL
ncbi:cobalamin B12-binding domain-containing protein [Clostridium sp. DL1XJH146]